MKSDHGQVNGSAAEHLAATAYLMNGYKVYHQDHESGSSDMLIEKEGTILKVQVKCFYWKTFGGKRNPQRSACLERSGYRKANINRDIRDEVDLFAVVDLDTAEVFSIPPQNKSSVNKSTAAKYKIYPVK